MVAGVILIAIGVGLKSNPQIAAFQPLPGIDFSIPVVVINLGLMIFLIPVITMFFISPLADAINARNAELEKTFTEAEQLRASMDQMKKDYEARLAATEASAREQIQNQIREAQALRQTLMAEATERADHVMQQALQQIEQEKAKALVEIRSAVVNLTLTATEKLIGENLDDARNRKLIEDFVSQTSAGVSA